MILVRTGLFGIPLNRPRLMLVMQHNFAFPLFYFLFSVGFYVFCCWKTWRIFLFFKSLFCFTSGFQKFHISDEVLHFSWFSCFFRVVFYVFVFCTVLFWRLSCFNLRCSYLVINLTSIAAFSAPGAISLSPIFIRGTLPITYLSTHLSACLPISPSPQPHPSHFSAPPPPFSSKSCLL